MGGRHRQGRDPSAAYGQCRRHLGMGSRPDDGHQHAVGSGAASVSGNRHDAEIAARMAQGLGELPIIRDPEESWYVRQERDGLILGPYEKDAQPWSVDGVPPRFGAELMPPDLDRVEHIIEAAMARIPALGTAASSR